MKKKILNFAVAIAIVLTLAIAGVYFIGYTVGVPTPGDKATVFYGMIIGAAAIKLIGEIQKLLKV